MQLLILDRDGVINEESGQFIKSAAEWRPIPGSLEAIAKANRAGYRVLVVSNQSGLARGIFTIDALNQIHREMHKQINAAGGAIDAIFFCPHGPDEGCQCRKPQPGLYNQIAERLRVSLRGVPTVGDRYRDLVAARDAGAQPILVRTGRGEQTIESENDLSEVSIYPDLAAVIDDITD